MSGWHAGDRSEGLQQADADKAKELSCQLEPRFQVADRRLRKHAARHRQRAEVEMDGDGVEERRAGRVAQAAEDDPCAIAGPHLPPSGLRNAAAPSLHHPALSISILCIASHAVPMRLQKTYAPVPFSEEKRSFAAQIPQRCRKLCEQLVRRRRDRLPPALLTACCCRHQERHRPGRRPLRRQ